MRYLHGFIFFLAAASVLCLSSHGGTDPMPLDWTPKGGAAMPQSPHKTIRMVSERVLFRMKKTSYTVDGVFHFYNTGGTTSEFVGFPKLARIGTGGRSMDFVRFNGWVDGRKVKFSLLRDVFTSPGTVPRSLSSSGGFEVSWMVCPIRFPGHALTKIRTTYESLYHTNSPGTVALADYIYESGSFWQGSIGRAVFIVDATDVGGIKNIVTDGLETSPGPRLISENLLIHQIREWEPRSATVFRVVVRR